MCLKGSTCVTWHVLINCNDQDHYHKTVFSFSQKGWETKCKILTVAIVFTMHMVVACGFHWTELDMYTSSLPNSRFLSISYSTFSRSIQSMEPLCRVPLLLLTWTVINCGLSEAGKHSSANENIRQSIVCTFTYKRFHLKHLLSRIIQVISVVFKHCQG